MVKPEVSVVASKRITNIVLMRIEWREMILAMNAIDVTGLWRRDVIE